MRAGGGKSRSSALVSGGDHGQAPPKPDGVGALLDAITSGACDRELAVLHDAIVRRLQTLEAIRSANALLDFDVGDRVELNGLARSLYLQGANGVVTGLMDQQVIVRLDRPIGLFRSGELRCSPLALDQI
jgi:hypothetical protein